MANTKDNKKSNSKIPNAQLESLIADSANRADRMRRDGLNRLAIVKRVKLTSTARERVRVQAKNGADDPRLKCLDEQMAFEHRQLIAALAESDRAAAPTETPGEQKWVLHGYVRNHDGHGMTGYKVSLFPDECGQKEPVVSTLTGKRGYFRYQLGKGPAKRLDDALEEAELEDAGKSRRAKVRKLYIGVTNPNGEMSHIDSQSTSIRLGTAVYRDIVVQARHKHDTDKRAPTRFLGDSREKLLHDLSNEKQSCCIHDIAPDNRYYFRNTDLADGLGFEYCGHCFGKTRSDS